MRLAFRCPVVPLNDLKLPSDNQNKLSLNWKALSIYRFQQHKCRFLWSQQVLSSWFLIWHWNINKDSEPLWDDRVKFSRNVNAAAPWFFTAPVPHQASLWTIYTVKSVHCYNHVINHNSKSISLSSWGQRRQKKKPVHATLINNIFYTSLPSPSNPQKQP